MIVCVCVCVCVCACMHACVYSDPLCALLEQGLRGIPAPIGRHDEPVLLPTARDVTDATLFVLFYSTPLRWLLSHWFEEGVSALCLPIRRVCVRESVCL